MMEDYIPPYFPEEVVSLIICALDTKNDIASCGAVCKMWKAIAAKHSPSWTSVLALPLFPPKKLFLYPKSKFNRALSCSLPHVNWYTSQVPKLQEFEFGLKDIDGKTGGSKYKMLGFVITGKDNMEEYVVPPMFDVKDTTVPVIPPRHYQENDEYYKKIIECLAICTDHPKLWRYSIYPIQQDIFKFEATPVPSFLFLVEVNYKEVEEYHHHKTPVPWFGQIVVAVARAHGRYLKKLREYDREAARIPMRSIIPQEQPPGIRDRMNLYKYQLDAVSWMKSIEDNVDKGYFVNNKIPWHGTTSTLSFNLDKYEQMGCGYGELRTTFNKICESENQEVHPRGGILADEMGLGKTLEIISLILANPKPPSTDSSRHSHQPTWKRGGQLSRYAESLLFQTKATLVICPSHIISQWCDEIIKCTNPPLRVVVATDLKTLGSQFKAIMEADVVLTVKKMVSFDVYNDMDELMTYKLDTHNLEQDSKYFETTPRLSSFFWWRVVMDEGHEFYSNIKGSTYTYHNRITPISAKYTWFVSSTPFVTMNYLPELLAYFHVSAKNSDDLHYLDLLLNTLYWRNTKKSIEKEYQLPTLVESLNLLTFTPFEKAVFADCDAKPEAQLCVCTHPLLCTGYASLLPKGDAFNLLKFQQALCNNKKVLIAEITNELETFKSQAQKSKEKLERGNLVGPMLSKQKRKLRAREFKRDHLTKILAREEQIMELLSKKISYDAKIEKTPIFTALPARSEGGEINSNNEHDSPMSNEKKGDHDQASSSKNTETAATSDVSPTKTRSKRLETKDNGKKTSISPPATPTIDKLTVAELKARLQDNGVKIPAKSKKADLQALLAQAIGDSKSTPGSSDHKRKRDEDEDEAEEPVKKHQHIETNKHEVTIMPPEQAAFEENFLEHLIVRYGTKIGNVLAYLRRLWTNTPSAKIIVFSQYNKILKLLLHVLQENNIEAAIVEGTLVQKSTAIANFKHAANVPVILMNTTVAASGTNLIEASHVMILDSVKGTRSQINGAEAQAIGRAHRQGQTRQVTVVRFIVRDTPEYTSFMERRADVQEEGIISNKEGFQRTSSSL